MPSDFALRFCFAIFRRDIIHKVIFIKCLTSICACLVVSQEATKTRESKLSRPPVLIAGMHVRAWADDGAIGPRITTRRPDPVSIPRHTRNPGSRVLNWKPCPKSVRQAGGRRANIKQSNNAWRGLKAAADRGAHFYQPLKCLVTHDLLAIRAIDRLDLLRPSSCRPGKPYGPKTPTPTKIRTLPKSCGWAARWDNSSVGRKSCFARLVQEPQTDDATLQLIAGFPKLQVADLAGTRVTDDGLGVFENLTEVNSINLEGTQITDAGLGKLTSLTKLELLNLSHTQVTDAGLAQPQTIHEAQEPAIDRNFDHRCGAGEPAGPQQARRARLGRNQNQQRWAKAVAGHDLQARPGEHAGVG